MAELTKALNKSEYNISKLDETEANLLIGGKDASVGKKVVPNMNVSWEAFTGKEQYFLNVNRKGANPTAKEKFSNGELAVREGDEEDLWELYPDEKVKWFVRLYSKPATNVFEWELKFNKGVTFHHQQSMADEWAEGQSKGWPETNMPLAEYLAKNKMADNVVNSYCIYCDKVGGHSDRKGKLVENYYAGKLGQIFRRKFIDNNGVETWLKQEIVNITDTTATLRVTIPQSVLDNAAYPALLNDKFGWSTIATTSASEMLNTIRGNVYAATGSGTVDNMVAYIDSTWDSGEEVKCALYDDDAADALVGVTVEDTTGHGADAWVTIAASGSFSVTSGTDYILCIWGGTGTASIWRDAVSIRRIIDTGANANPYTGSYPDPIGVTPADANFRYSLYVNFTVAGGARRVIIISKLLELLSNPLFFIPSFAAFILSKNPKLSRRELFNPIKWLKNLF